MLSRLRTVHLQVRTAMERRALRGSRSMVNARNFKLKELTLYRSSEWLFSLS